MPRLALVNIAIGFWVLAFSAAAGAFVATDLTATYIAEGTFHSTWESVLTASAHGHTNLFGMIHIAFGLTLPYSRVSQKWQSLQTAGLGLGVLAMGPGMIIRSRLSPTVGNDPLGIVMGCLLSAALAAIFTHAVALTGRLIGGRR